MKFIVIKKFLKKNNPINTISIITLIILIFIFLNQINFLKKIYIISKDNYQERFKKAYGYCGKDSVGYINYINKKFQLKKKPIIINYSTRPVNDWVFFDINLEKSQNEIIILNYKKNIFLNFLKIDIDKNKNYYIASSFISNASGIKNIKIKSPHKIEFNGIIKIFKISVGSYNASAEKFKDKIDLKKLNEIYSQNIKKEDIKNNIIEINRKLENINTGDELNLILLESDSGNIINYVNSIEISFTNVIELNKYKILDNYSNSCLFLKKND